MTEHRVEANGVDTFYEVDGPDDGDPVVMLHGGFVSNESWASQRAALAERYHLYLPERRAHGHTPDVPGPLGFDVQAEDTIAFMAAVGLPSAHLIGWSDGGIIALEVALRRPDLVRSQVLIGAVAHVDGATAEAQQELAAMTADGLGPYVRDMYDRLSPDGPEHFEVVFERLVAVWRTEPTHELSELAKIAAPTLIVVGDRDVVSVQHAAAMQRSIPNAQLAVVPGADHFLLFSKSDLANRLFLDFLEGAAEAPGS
ncbi:MAG TPA: alpha/beta hydrolase [Candidatus Polarisedimenticolia bacterium]|nr:alpha/beta hydrolase [Candidatus Polarisedimenticolia bacterium]